VPASVPSATQNDPEPSKIGFARYGGYSVETMQDLGPLTEQVQRWWDAQHAHCRAASDSYGPSSDGLSWLFRSEEFVPYAVVCPSTCGWRNGKTSEELLSGIKREVKASAVRAARLLNEPNERAAEKVVSALLPPPYGDELNLVTDLIKAAGAQSIYEQNQAFKGAAIAAVTVVGLCLLGRGNQKAA
jgi:hypothetical protein